MATDGDKQHEARLLHFSEDLPPEYFAGIVSETFNPRTNRFDKKRGARNEPLDTLVYSYAAAHHPEVRLHLYTNQKWDDLLAKYSHLLNAVERREQAAAMAANPQVNPSKPSKLFIPE